MTDEEIKVLNLISSDREKPTKANKIQKETGFSKRVIRSIIDRLVMKYDKPIVANRATPQGYYLAQSKNDLVVGLRGYKKQLETEKSKLEHLYNIEF